MAKEQTVQYNETTELKLEEKSVKTRDEIYVELGKTFAFLAATNIAIRNNADLLSGVLAELVHWMHDASGTHASPSELLMQYFSEQAGLKSTDETPAKDTKTND